MKLGFRFFLVGALLNAVLFGAALERAAAGRPDWVLLAVNGGIALLATYETLQRRRQP